MYEKFCLFLITPGLTSNESFKLLTFFEQNSWLAVLCVGFLKVETTMISNSIINNCVGASKPSVYSHQIKFKTF